MKRTKEIQLFVSILILLPFSVNARDCAVVCEHPDELLGDAGETTRLNEDIMRVAVHAELETRLMIETLMSQDGDEATARWKAASATIALKTSLVEVYLKAKGAKDGAIDLSGIVETAAANLIGAKRSVGIIPESGPGAISADSLANTHAALTRIEEDINRIKLLNGRSSAATLATNLANDFR